MARIILHIGAHKTATSYVQRMLLHNRAALAARGLIYPDIGPSAAHHILTTPWIDTPEIDSKYFRGLTPSRYFDAFVAEHAKGGGTVFVSAESFSRAKLQQVDMADLARRLEPFDEVRILYTTRQQASYLQSIWLERIKGAKPPPWHRFYRAALEHGLASGLWLDHGDVYAHLLTGFSPDQITFCDYDALRRSDGGVLRGLFAQIGFAVDDHALSDIGKDQGNISPDPLSSLIAAQMAFPDAPDLQFAATLRDAMGLDPTQKTSLYDPDQLAALVERYEPANRKLEQTLSDRQPDFKIAPVAVEENCFLHSDLNPPHWLKLARHFYRLKNA